MFKRPRPYKKIVLLLIIFLLAGSLFIFLDRRVRPSVYSIAEVKVTQMAVEAINQAVRSEVVESGITYRDFITWQKDSNGRVAAMQANVLRVNQVQADIALEVQKKLQELRDKEIAIPLGQLLGSFILAHWGPKIKIKMTPVGTVDVQVDDTFEHAGINQTRHRIYLDFVTMVRIWIPLGSAEVKVATQVPVAESVIVGDVPQVVADFSGGIFGTLGK